MRTAQLKPLAAAFMLATAMGCNRAETQEQTQRAADEVRTAAARAGDKLADSWLTTRIQAQYFADDQIKARYIDVKTDDGVVTIKGFVETPAAHERALQIARHTDGVKQVNDQILIGQSPAAFESEQRPVATSGGVPPATTGAVTDDERITRTIQASFFLDPAIKGRQIDVQAQNGIVTLNGEVASESERAQALVHARNAPGVSRVEDNLRVNAALEQPASAASSNAGPAAPPAGAAPAGAASAPSPAPAPVADDSALTAAVKSKLSADPQLAGIDVNVSNGVVQMQGTVSSAAAHQRALRAARDTDGVKQVVDRLRVSK